MAGILFFLRLTGKIQMAKLTPLDNVNALVLGAIVGSTIYTPGITIWLQLFAMASWTLLNVLLRYLMHKNILRNIIQGRDEVLIENGIIDLKVMKRNNLTISELRAKLRELDIYSLKDVDKVRFETDGQFTVHQKNQGPESYLLVSSGELQDNSRKAAGLTKEWINKQLKQIGYGNLKDIYAAEWTPGEGFYVIGTDGKITDKDLSGIPSGTKPHSGNKNSLPQVHTEDGGQGSPNKSGRNNTRAAAPGKTRMPDSGNGSGSRSSGKKVVATPPPGLGSSASTSRRTLPGKSSKSND